MLNLKNVQGEALISSRVYRVSECVQNHHQKPLLATPDASKHSVTRILANLVDTGYGRTVVWTCSIDYLSMFT